MFYKNSDLWPSDAVRDLCEAWSQGMSTREIALALTLRYGQRWRTFTKNMVVGKVHRLHLEPRPSPLRGVPVRQPKPPEVFSYKRRNRRIDKTISVVWDLTKIVAWPDVWDDLGDWPPVPSASPAAKVARLAPRRNPTVRQETTIAAAPEAADPIVSESAIPTISVLSEPPSFVRSKVVSLVFSASGERRRCQFPFGEPRRPDFHFCGQSTRDAGGPYCQKHYDICHERPKSRRNDAA